MDDDDPASKSIKQLGVFSMMLGVDKEIMKNAMATLMERVVHGESSSRAIKYRHRQPLRLPKWLHTRMRGTRQGLLTQQEFVDGQEKQGQQKTLLMEELADNVVVDT